AGRALSLLPVRRRLAARHRRRLPARGSGLRRPLARHAARGLRDAGAGRPDRSRDRVRQPGAAGGRPGPDRLIPVGLSLDARDIALVYPLGGGAHLRVLDLASFVLEAGEAAGLTGPSGSGKTSLLYVCTGLERPERGRVVWDTTDIARLSEGARDRWRREHVGFVFQEFHLVSSLSALDNVLLPATFRHIFPPKGLEARARDLLTRVGVASRPGPVGRLARGEMQ